MATSASQVKLPEALIPLGDVKDVLSVSAGTVFRLIRTGQLPVVRIGGRTLVEPAALRDFIAVRRSSDPKQHEARKSSRASRTSCGDDRGEGTRSSSA
jgi:excisionase family DNA binding protein